MTYYRNPVGFFHSLIDWLWVFLRVVGFNAHVAHLLIVLDHPGWQLLVVSVASSMVYSFLHRVSNCLAEWCDLISDSHVSRGSCALSYSYYEYSVPSTCWDFLGMGDRPALWLKPSGQHRLSCSDLQPETWSITLTYSNLWDQNQFTLLLVKCYIASDRYNLYFLLELYIVVVCLRTVE